MALFKKLSGPVGLALILVGGVAGFTPLAGFRAIYSAETLFQAFTALTLTY